MGLVCYRNAQRARLLWTSIFEQLVCFGFRSPTILIALLDARAVALRTRQEQKDLFEKTLTQIEAEAKARPRRSDRKQGKS